MGSRILILAAGSPIQAQQTQSTFHRRAQRNASRCRDVRQQSRSLARWNQSLRHSPNSALLRFSAIISRYFFSDIFPKSFRVREVAWFYLRSSLGVGKMLARKRTREFQPCAFCLRIFLSATRSRTARRNFSRSAGLSMSSLRFVASATVLA